MDFRLSLAILYYIADFKRGRPFWVRPDLIKGAEISLDKEFWSMRGTQKVRDSPLLALKMEYATWKLMWVFASKVRGSQQKNKDYNSVISRNSSNCLNEFLTTHLHSDENTASKLVRALAQDSAIQCLGLWLAELLAKKSLYFIQWSLYISIKYCKIKRHSILLKYS